MKKNKLIRRGWNKILNWLIPSFESLLPPPSRLDKRKDLKRYDIGEYSWGHLVVSNRSPDSHLKIGKFCSFAYGCHILLGGEHRSDFITTYRLSAYDPFRKIIKKADRNESSTKGNVSIGNDVWIGHNSIILSGVEIGNGAIIGAGSVVRRNVPAYSIVAGNPARVAGFRFEQHQIDELERIEWWNWPLERIVGNVDILMSENVEDFIKKNQR